jgi:hypothetical protein
LLPYLRKRSKIIEIVAARDIVFALSQSGVCAAFSRGMLVFFLSFCVIRLIGAEIHFLYFQRQTREYAFLMEVLMKLSAAYFTTKIMNHSLLCQYMVQKTSMLCDVGQLEQSKLLVPYFMAMLSRNMQNTSTF